MTFIDQLRELALTQNSEHKVQAGKLDLARTMRNRQVLEKPIIKRAMIFELKRAKRVSGSFQRVRQRVGEIVHRINAPPVPSALVGDFSDTVQSWVTQIEIGRSHINFGAQHMFTFFEITSAHGCK